MHENNFEKEVQKKMDQLAFDPSDNVWANVNKGINEDKKRRRPLFWLFFLVGPIVIGAGYFIIANNHSETPSGFRQLTRPDSAQAKRSSTETASNTGSMDQFVKKPVKASEQLAGQANKPKLSNKDNSNRQGRTSQSKNILKPANIHVPAESKSEENESASASAKMITPDAVHSIRQTNQPSPDREDSSSVNKTKNEQFKKAMEDSASQTKTVKNKDRKKASWKIGFTGGVGISDMNHGLFKQSNSTPYTLYMVSNGSGGSGVNYYYPYLHSGFSFSAGGFASRSITERLSVSAGLNYHYYSTQTSVGNLVSNPINPGNLPVQYFAINYNTNYNGYNYVNQYHFIELPVLADFTLNKSKRLPIIWEGGFSFEYLVSTNALYFDPSANVFDKSMQLFNRAQWSAATALLIGFNVHKSQFRLGPQVQFGLTDLLKNNAAIPQHLVSYGLKISFIPHNK